MTGVVYFITVVGLTMFANLTTPAFAAQQDCIAEVNACQEANCPGGQGTTEEQHMACAFHTVDVLELDLSGR
jgi:hypothetical protein